MRDAGIIGFVPRGEYSPAETYDFLQFVYYNGSTYVAKKETVKGKIPSGYDDIKDYVIIAQTETTGKSPYQLGNITVEYV